MAIAVANDGGWKRPTIGPGLEAFTAGDMRDAGGAAIAAGGPTDARTGVPAGAPATIGLAEPARAPVAPAPLGDRELLALIQALVGVLAALTQVVANLVEQRGIPAAA